MLLHDCKHSSVNARCSVDQCDYSNGRFTIGHGDTLKVTLFQPPMHMVNTLDRGNEYHIAHVRVREFSNGSLRIQHKPILVRYPPRNEHSGRTVVAASNSTHCLRLRDIFPFNQIITDFSNVFEDRPTHNRNGCC